MSNKKQAKVNKENTNNKKEANTNPYLCALSDRLRELRTKKDLSQQGLATKAGTIREKIMYAELNIKGRVLKVDELAEIAKVLETTPDYLLGISNSRMSDNNNGLSDSTNVLANKMKKSQIGLLDKMIPEIEEQKQLDFLQIYIIVAYVNKNILPHILNDVKLKIESNRDLTSIDIQKVAFLTFYLDTFRNQNVEYTDYINFLTNNYAETIKNARNEIGQLTFYNNDKYIKVNFDTIRQVTKMLNEFESYVEYEVFKRLKKTINEMTYNYIKDDTYFNEIKQLFNEIVNSNNEKLK